uniref:Structure-specific endonuclease subunit SLX1 homolog n=1 Tax=Phallusia mammillata TaxID=59560 RepID=A0A6F9DT60_9ASCI|nr:structure-specific endonuclease subunit slx1-like [Phallusia mammillata]
MVVAIDNFFGCYLLYCKNPKYKGRTYIGFTVNPERRIKQHNAGKLKGGAWRTSGRGPWDMALIVHGFPSDIAALRFEWAWQNPDRSRRLRHVPGKKKKESAFAFRVRVMASMLCQTPWKKLPLVVRWLKQEYALDLDPIAPTHVPIAYGPVTAKHKKHKAEADNSQDTDLRNQQPVSSEESDSDSDEICMSLMHRITKKTQPPTQKKPKGGQNYVECSICSCNIVDDDDDKLSCISKECPSTTHLICLAKHFTSKSAPHQLLPVEGNCPVCEVSMLWGDLIRETQGFHQYLRATS